MTKEVSVIIEGLQLGSEEEPLTTTAFGTYHLHNGKHYIQYEERLEVGEVTKNTIKIGLTRVDLSKNGVNSSQMAFDLNEITSSVYQTPYGSLSFEIKTTKILLTEAQDRLLVQLDYTLFANEAHLLDNSIKISILSDNGTEQTEQEPE
jgi:uncharacterized beta-barrel protein YwiB (DUF1934 family)